MSCFTIELEPNVPPAPYSPPAISIDEIVPRRIFYEEENTYDVRYKIDGRTFCYYPASLLTVFYDLFNEWELSKSRTSHNMTLSGYTTLELVFTDGQACFYDPVERARDQKTKPVGEPFDPHLVEQTFKAAVEGLWFLIKSIE